MTATSHFLASSRQPATAAVAECRLLMKAGRNMEGEL